MALLAPHELEIMTVLWEQGPLKPGEIQEKLPYPVKNSALRWQLAALVEKGLVARKKQGKAYLYRAKTARQTALRRLSRRLAEVFAGGSAVALVGQILESQVEISKQELEELKQIAEGKAKKKVGK